MSRSVVSGPPTSAVPLQLQSEGQRRGGGGERGESVGMACSISQEAVCGRRIRYGDLFGAHLSGREASHTGGMPASLLAASLPPRCPCQTNASSVCVLKTRVETTCQSDRYSGSIQCATCTFSGAVGPYQSSGNSMLSIPPGPARCTGSSEVLVTCSNSVMSHQSSGDLEISSDEANLNS